MQLYYTTEISGNHAVLDKSDSGHLIKVMRMKKGDMVHLTDGLGNLYEGLIEIDDPKKTMVQLRDVKKDFGKRDFYLHMAVAPTKNISRFEWFLEKPPKWVLMRSRRSFVCIQKGRWSKGIVRNVF